MEKFYCKIDSKVINDLNTQISNSRIINWAPNYNQQAGISYDNLSYILEYWRNEFSWTKEEEKLNKFNQYLFEYDKVKTHECHAFLEGLIPNGKERVNKVVQTLY